MITFTTTDTNGRRVIGIGLIGEEITYLYLQPEAEAFFVPLAQLGLGDGTLVLCRGEDDAERLSKVFGMCIVLTDSEIEEMLLHAVLRPLSSIGLLQDDGMIVLFRGGYRSATPSDIERAMRVVQDAIGRNPET